MERAFEKWEGLGNDFVVLDLRGDQAFAATPEETRAAKFRALCDRHRGIGADGVLAVVDSPRALAKMLVYNADGSRPEMCGNGLRCVAGFLVAAGASPSLEIDTEAGLKRCDVTATPPGFSIRVDMGPARDLGLRDGHGARIRDVDIGNPHAILFDGPGPGGARDELAKLLEWSREGRTNVEFARVRDGAIDLVVWERGVGYTEACGTGACATVFAACVEGRLSWGARVVVNLPGGPLVIAASEDGAVEMRGPARRAFRGTVDVGGGA